MFTETKLSDKEYSSQKNITKDFLYIWRENK